MLEYKPWSQAELEKSIIKYKSGTFSILDIELSGACNFNCVYCDTPNHHTKCRISFNDLDRLMSEKVFDWVFICGLGEPTAGANYNFLLQILDACRRYSVKCSIFSNGSLASDKLIEYIDDGILHILFKYDSADKKLNANVYGTSNTKAGRQVINVQKLMRHVQCQNNMTNIGASIVPTRFNVNIIPQIVEECLDKNIYPLIGDLENAGRGQDHFSALSLNGDELALLKEKVESIIGEKYEIPICPSVISGIHISSDSKIVVDGLSGLTCPWFWLEEPQLHQIMDLDSTTLLPSIKQKILDFRDLKLDEVISLKEEYVNRKNNGAAFGGCGGDIPALLNQYISIQTELRGGIKF